MGHDLATRAILSLGLNPPLSHNHAIGAKRRAGNLYTGVLDSDPGRADGLCLREGAEGVFSAEHVIAISRPPKGYVLDKYGPAFFDQ